MALPGASRDTLHLGDAIACPILSEQVTLFGERDCIGWKRGRLSVSVMDRLAADAVIIAHHYSHTTAANHSYIHLAIQWDDQLRGVAQYGYAMNPASAGGVVRETRTDEYLELNRLWLDDDMPCNSESAALALSFKFIRRAYPRIAWIQSFADERCGRFGAIYQAANFLYCGEHSSVFWELDGQMYHNTHMTNGARMTGPRAAWLRANRDRAVRRTFRQFRYVRFLRPAFKARLLLPPKPYPKPHTRKA